MKLFIAWVLLTYPIHQITIKIMAILYEEEYKTLPKKIRKEVQKYFVFPTLIAVIMIWWAIYFLIS